MSCGSFDGLPPGEPNVPLYSLSLKAFLAVPLDVCVCPVLHGVELGSLGSLTRGVSKHLAQQDWRVGGWSLYIVVSEGSTCKAVLYTRAIQGFMI